MQLQRDGLRHFDHLPHSLTSDLGDFVGAGEQHWDTARPRNCGVLRLFINSNLDILKTTGYRRSACQRSANIAFNGLPDQFDDPLS